MIAHNAHRERRAEGCNANTVWKYTDNDTNVVVVIIEEIQTASSFLSIILIFFAIVCFLLSMKKYSHVYSAVYALLML